MNADYIETARRMLGLPDELTWRSERDQLRAGAVLLASRDLGHTNATKIAAATGIPATAIGNIAWFLRVNGVWPSRGVNVAVVYPWAVRIGDPPIYPWAGRLLDTRDADAIVGFVRDTLVGAGEMVVVRDGFHVEYHERQFGDYCRHELDGAETLPWRRCVSDVRLPGRGARNREQPTAASIDRAHRRVDEISRRQADEAARRHVERQRAQDLAAARRRRTLPEPAPVTLPARTHRLDHVARRSLGGWEARCECGATATGGIKGEAVERLRDHHDRVDA